jgi:hypothetical protein
MQGGVLMSVTWFALVGACTLHAHKLPSHPMRDHAVGWGVAILLCAPLSNDVLTRVTLVWWVFAVLGAASAHREAPD